MSHQLSQPLPYTSSPISLAAQDIYLFFQITFVWPITAGIPSIILPFLPFRSGALDELYPSFQNLKATFLHLVLIVAQAIFLVLLVPSFFFGVPVPLLAWTPTCLLIVVGYVVVNNWFCILLNGKKRRFASVVDPKWDDHSDEKWVFINGVAVGEQWMQSNLDKLALTFRRPIHGIHNKTRGIIFDVIETIIQRTFGYATPDVRAVYNDVQEFIQDAKDGARRYKKIVLILHSQGSVEGGLVMDWLFATVERSLLERVEVYTFGNAANHFCNPPEEEGGRRVVKHIEHYANMGDYVALFGILHFRPLPRRGGRIDATAREEIENTYVGRLFVRKGSGHQMNGNYLDNFFAMNEELTAVTEGNEFMDSVLNEEIFSNFDIASRMDEKDLWECKEDANKDGVRQIKEVSRLWCYRNGGSPEDLDRR